MTPHDRAVAIVKRARREINNELWLGSDFLDGIESPTGNFTDLVELVEETIQAALDEANASIDRL